MDYFSIAVGVSVSALLGFFAGAWWATRGESELVEPNVIGMDGIKMTWDDLNLRMRKVMGRERNVADRERAADLRDQRFRQQIGDAGVRANSLLANDPEPHKRYDRTALNPETQRDMHIQTRPVSQGVRPQMLRHDDSGMVGGVIMGMAMGQSMGHSSAPQARSAEPSCETSQSLSSDSSSSSCSSSSSSSSDSGSSGGSSD